MPIRYQADADLNQVIVSAVVRRVPAIDFRTATAAGLAGLKDQEVLAVAAFHKPDTSAPDDGGSPLPLIPIRAAAIAFA